MSWTRLLIAMIGVTLAGQAQAKSSLIIEVREATKARLTSADVVIKALNGKQVLKMYAASGRLALASPPVGTFNLEARSRQGNLVGTARVVVKPDSQARAVITIRPPPPTPAKAVTRPPTRAVRPTTKKAPPRRPGPVTASRTAAPPTTAKKVALSGSAMPLARDWGKGKSNVCRGDVFDLKGRRISGKLQLLQGNKPIGFANVITGHFSLFDLKTGTYQLRFTSSDGKRRVNTNAAIVAGKLAKVVLKVP